MSNTIHSVVRSAAMPLLGSLAIVLSLTGCGGEQSAESGDNGSVAENVKKVGSVETTEAAAKPAAESTPAKEASPAPAAAPAESTGTAAAPAESTAAAPAEKPAESAPAAPAQAAAGGAIDGEAVYKKACFACHMAGVANAPKAGDKAAWAPRVAKGMDALLHSALNGVPGTAMPPKGNCGACSEEELKAAIKFMSGQ